MKNMEQRYDMFVLIDFQTNVTMDASMSVLAQRNMHCIRIPGEKAAMLAALKPISSPEYMQVLAKISAELSHAPCYSVGIVFL